MGTAAPAPSSARSVVLQPQSQSRSQSHWDAASIRMVAALQQCRNARDVRRGEQLHSEAIRRGLLTNTCVATTLINMYAACGSLSQAQAVFYSLAHPTVVSWNALLCGYLESGNSQATLDLFLGMQEACVASDDKTYAAAIKACARLAADEKEQNRLGRASNMWLERGKAIHSEAVLTQCCNARVQSVLIKLYAECGSIKHAESVFGSMVDPDPTCFSIMFHGYLKNRENRLVWDLFQGMDEGGYELDSRLYVPALRACAALVAEETEGHYAAALVTCEDQDDFQCWETSSALGLRRSKWLERGKAIHSAAVINSRCDAFVTSALINMYAKCGNMIHAREVFDSVVSPDIQCWNRLLEGYIDNGDRELALELSECMEQHVESLNSRTYTILLAALLGKRKGFRRSWSGPAMQLEVENVKKLHSKAVMDECCNSFVEGLVVGLYAKAGNMVHAFEACSSVQPNAVTWTELIQGYVQSRQWRLALEVFDTMDEAFGVTCRGVVAALTACADLALEAREAGKLEECAKWLEKGKAIHSRSLRSSCCDTYVEATLVDFYGKCGSMVHARSVFDGIAYQRTVPWNCLIMGYACNGESEVALEMLAHMEACGVRTHALTFAAALVACSNLLDLTRGIAFHEEIRNRGLEQELGVQLINFYGRCGSLKGAQQVFDSIGDKTGAEWTMLMWAYGIQGKTDHVFHLFQLMTEENGIQPCEVTFSCLLFVCTHAGLTTKGKQLFDEMHPKYGVKPDRRHHTSVIDLLARGNRLDEALEVATSMAYEADFVIWTSILSACVKWKNLSVGIIAFRKAVSLNEKDSSTYVLMAQIYSSLGMTEEEAEVLVDYDEKSNEKITTRRRIGEFGNA